MNKADFLRKLDRELSVLDQEERKEILSFYEERFYTGTNYENKTELDIINELENPEIIAKNVLEEYGVSPKFVKNKEERYSNVSMTRLVWLIIFDLLVASWLIPTLYGVVISLFTSLISYIGVLSLLVGEVTTMDLMLFGFTTGGYILLFLLALVVLELTIWVTKKIVMYHLNVFKIKNREKIAKKLNKFSVDEWFKKHKLLNTLKSLSFIGSIVLMVFTGFYLFTGDESIFDVYGNQPQLTIINQEDLSQDILDGSAWDIETDFGSMEVEVYAVTGDEITITHTYTEDRNYNIVVDDELNKITITNDKEDNFVIFNLEQLLSLFNGGDKVVIEVPEYLLLDYVNIESSNGRVQIRNLSINEIGIVTLNGAISLDTITVNGDISAKTSNGDVKVKHIIGQYDLDVSTSNGRIILDDLEMRNYDLHTSNGKIIVDNLNIVSYDGITLYARTSNGAIDMNEVYVADIDIKTTNGDIDFYNTDTSFLPDSYEKDTSNGTINSNVR